MATVLHVIASPNGARSASGRIARAFLEEYAKHHPDDAIVERPLFTTDLPEFGAVEAEAKFAPLFGERLTPRHAAAWARIEAEIGTLDAADKVLLSCPMWNLGIPYKLKQYIDVIVQPRLTFTYDPTTMQHVGVLRNRPLQLILTRSSVLPGDFSDFQLPYLKYVFEFIGIRDIRVLAAWQTTRPTAEARDQYVSSFFPAARDAARAF